MSGKHNLSDCGESFESPTLLAPQSAVCVRNREARRSLSLDTCHIGRISKYFKLDGQVYCIIKLFLRSESLPDTTDCQSYKLDKFKEVVEPCFPILQQFLVIDIISPCEIIYGNWPNSVDSYLQGYDCNKPCYVLRFKLEEKETNNFIIKPLCFSSEDKMVVGKSEILSEKELNSEGIRSIASNVKRLKSPRRVGESPVACHEDVKENCAANSSSSIPKHCDDSIEHEESSRRVSKERGPLKTTVRRSLVSDLDFPPVKQKRTCDDTNVSSCVVMLENVNTDSDSDSIFKDSWVSELLDANLPFVENGRCPTPIRLSLKRIRPDITPSKTDANGRFRKKSGSIDSDDDEKDGADIAPRSRRTRASSAVTPSRRSARKTKCAVSLAESMTDSDSENVSTPKPRSARENLSKTDAESSSANPQTPKGKAGCSDAVGIRSTRRNSTWEAEESKITTSNRSRKLQTPSEMKPNPDNEVEDLLPSLESRTPLSKRKRGKSLQTEEDSAQEPKPPASTKSRKSKPHAIPEGKQNSEEVEDLTVTRTPSSKRQRGKTPQPHEDCDEPMTSPVESKTPLALRTPNRTSRVDKTPQKTPKTASKTLTKSPRTPKAKPTVKTPSRSALTPSMPARATAPLTPMSSLEQIRKNLHVSAVPMSLPCRESEYRNIYNFLENKIRDSAGGCMYISGVPGTGKTATVNAVVRSLKKLVDSKKLKDFQYIETNGLRMTEPRQVFVQVLKALTGQKCTPQQAQDMLAERFCSGSAKNKTVVLLVDEVDMLRNRRQDVIYNLFDWPSKPNSCFIVLTIANTMDLPERLLKGRVTSRLGLTRLTFQPYSYKQLQEIVLSRLQGSNSFNDDAVELVARKVAACSGDVRRALDICRRASEMVEEGNPVTMPIVNQVLSQMMNSANVCSIKACSRLEKLFLQAIVAENERTGVEETSFISVYRQFQSFCALSSVTLINISEAMALLNRLGTSGLLLTEHSRADINQSIFLNVNADDIHYALNQSAPVS